MQRRENRRGTLLRLMARVMQQPHQARGFASLLEVERVRNLLLAFLIGDFHRLVLVSGSWFYSFNTAIKEQLEELDNKFIKAYMDVLLFKNSEFRRKALSIGMKKSFRWDRLIQAEVQPKHAGKCVTLTLRYNHDCRCEYKFDILERHAKRTVWLVMEETKHNFNSVAQTNPIPPVAAGDSILISINFFNKIGFMNLDTVVFDPPRFEPSKPRECPTQRQFFDWVYYEYYTNKQTEMIDIKKYTLFPRMKMIDLKCAGIDTQAYKFVYEVQEKGMVKKEFLGLPIELKGNGEEIVTEVRKVGLVSDLELPLQLRKHDILEFYLTMGD